MKRELEPYAAPTDTSTGLPAIGAGGGRLQLPGAVTIRPTQYRYRTLIERAKQLVTLAQQMEATFLPMLEKQDVELYNQLKAQQDVQLARAGVRLQDLRVTEAANEVSLAELQKGRAEIQEGHYTELLVEGWLWQETIGMVLTGTAAGIHLIAGASAIGLGVYGFIAGGFFGAAASVPEGGATAPVTIPVGGLVGGATGITLSQMVLGGASSLAQAASTTASLFQTWASYERRRQDWEFQKQLATQDVAIGSQQITIANDRKRIVGQEYQIAEIKSDHTDEVVEFLNNKFTSAELYDWMSGILEEVYRFFLQHATAMAKLAENQLAFQRQEMPPAFIRADYWEAPSEGVSVTSSEGSTTDRRGLTGSARLLRDIYQLDQHAFETDQRKLQLTRTISLARLDPYAFRKFIETGVMVFGTPMAMFDRDFPGHYLRLIKRIRTSVIALIPPTEGIRATLTTSGVSRVVIGGNVFQEVTIRRDPESVALTSPQNATGLFELQQEPEKMLPFECTGIDAIWEFRMPKASNPFDFRTIADVLITIEYTALDSYNHRQQVLQQLDRTISADRPFSFRHQFADLWYELHNPKQDGTPMVVGFDTRREDFPPNIEYLKIQHVLLYFALKEGASFTEEVQLRFNEQNSPGAVGGGATPIDNVISTRGGNASSWSSMRGKSPIGKWELALPDTDEVKNLFNEGQIEDILFVITYSGETPDWPE